MMSPDNIPAKPATTDDNRSSGVRKTASQRPPEQPLKCPRCDSPKTKFCYYNNYSLTQPRHFCKTCKRYWTEGGALRNVPIGGGCRKNKKTKLASTLSGSDSKDTGGLNFFHELSPAMEFQLSGGLPFSRPGVYNNHFLSFGNLSSSTNIDDMGFNHPVASFHRQAESGGFKFNEGIQEMGSMNVDTSLTSSIEFLSSMNQDLHWKLQQQRLAMVNGGEIEKDGGVSSLPVNLLENQTQKAQPILFQNLEIPTTTTNANSSSKGNDCTSNWNGIQAWSDLHQYSGLP